MRFVKIIFTLLLFLSVETGPALASGRAPPAPDFIALSQVITRHYFYRLTGVNFAPEQGSAMPLCSRAEYEEMIKRASALPKLSPSENSLARVQHVFPHRPCMPFLMHFPARRWYFHFRVQFAAPPVLGEFVATVRSAQKLYSVLEIEVPEDVYMHYWFFPHQPTKPGLYLSEGWIFNLWRRVETKTLTRTLDCFSLHDKVLKTTKIGECNGFLFE